MLYLGALSKHPLCLFNYKGLVTYVRVLEILQNMKQCGYNFVDPNLQITRKGVKAHLLPITPQRHYPEFLMIVPISRECSSYNVAAFQWNPRQNSYVSWDVFPHLFDRYFTGKDIGPSDGFYTCYADELPRILAEPLKAAAEIFDVEQHLATLDR